MGGMTFDAAAPCLPPLWPKPERYASVSVTPSRMKC